MWWFVWIKKAISIKVTSEVCMRACFPLLRRNIAVEDSQESNSVKRFFQNSWSELCSKISLLLPLPFFLFLSTRFFMTAVLLWKRPYFLHYFLGLLFFIFLSLVSFLFYIFLQKFLLSLLLTHSRFQPNWDQKKEEMRKSILRGMWMSLLQRWI